MSLVVPQNRPASVGTVSTVLFTAAVFVLVTAAAMPVAAQEVTGPIVAGPIPSHGKPEDSAHNYIFYSTP